MTLNNSKATKLFDYVVHYSSLFQKFSFILPLSLPWLKIPNFYALIYHQESTIIYYVASG